MVGELSSQEALDQAADEWAQIVQKLGIESQKSQYRTFVGGRRRLGYKI